MTTHEKVQYAIAAEVDQYINLVQEHAIESVEVNKFIIEYVVPRFNKLKEMVGLYSGTIVDIPLLKL